MAWASYMLTESLPYWPINPSINVDLLVQLPARLRPRDVGRAAGAMLWGASFPLALASVARGQGPGTARRRRLRGQHARRDRRRRRRQPPAHVWLGTQRSQQVMIVLSAMAALLVLDAAAHRDGCRGGKGACVSPGRCCSSERWPRRCCSRGASTTSRPDLVAYGRYAATRVGEADVIYMGEGWNASVAVTRLSNGVLNYHNAGKVQASSEPQDMRLQRMLGHMTTLVPKRPEERCSSSAAARASRPARSRSIPRVERLTIAEIEPLVPSVVSKYFGEHNFSVVTTPRRGSTSTMRGTTC
jgi:spermidine synthase